MAIVQLPVNSNSANYQFKTTLDGTNYIFYFRYNNRMSAWIMDILTESGIDLLRGIPLLLGYLLLQGFTDLRLPQGTLFMINIEDEYAECGRNDLGNNCLLLYEEV